MTPAELRTVPPTPAMIAGIVFGVFGVAFEVIAVATAMPAAAADLGGLGAYTWAFTMFIIGQLLGTALGGRVADRYGPVRPLYVGMAVFVTGLLAAGFSLSWIQLLLSRLVQGLGAGVMFVSLFVVVARIFNAADRARVMAWLSAAWVLPAFVGPLIAGFLTEQASWHWVFFSVIPLVVVSALLIRPIIRGVSQAGMLQGSSEATDPVPLWAPLVIASGAVTLQGAGQLFALGQSVLAAVAALLGAGLVLLALPRLMPQGFVRFRRGLPSVIWCRMIFPGAFFGAEAILPLMLVQTRGISLIEAGFVLSLGAIGWAVGAWFQSRGWVGIRRDQLIVLGGGAVAVAIGLAAVPAWLIQVPAWLVGVAWAFGGFGMGLAVASTSLVVMALSPRVRQGRNSASLQIGEQLGVAVLAGLAGSILAAVAPMGDLHLSFGTAITTMAVIAVAAVPFALRIGAIRDANT